jgi:hypothetical protein
MRCGSSLWFPCPLFLGFSFPFYIGILGEYKGLNKDPTHEAESLLALRVMHDAWLTGKV